MSKTKTPKNSTSKPAQKALRKKAQRIARGEAVGLSEEEQLKLLRLIHELELTQFQLGQAQVEVDAKDEQLRKISREFEASRRELWELYEFVPVAFMVLNKKGIVQNANAAAVQMLCGRTDGQLINLAFSNFVYPEDIGTYFRSMKRLSDGEEISIFELRLVDRTGNPIPVHCQALAKFDPEGGFSCWHLAFIDVSEQKRLEDALQRSREYLELATSAGGVGTWIFELESGKSYWNEQIYLMLGLDPRRGPEEQDTLLKFIHPQDRQEAQETTQAAVKLGDEIDLEFRIIRADDGRVRWLRAKGSVDRNEGGRAARLRGAIWDITDSKQVEEIMSGHRAQLELEVKNRTAEIEAQYKELAALNAIIRQLSRKAIKDMENDRRALSKEIHDGITGTLTAIKMQLENHLSRAAKGSPSNLMPLEKIVAYLDEAIRETRSISYQLRSRVLDELGLKPALLEHFQHFKQFYPGIEVVSQIDAADEAIPADIQTVLYRVVQEAVNNAGKHSAATQVHVKLTNHQKHVRLEVADNGHGFDLQQTMSHANSFTGYGILSMRERVEICNGKFQIQSEPGKGTVIDISIPL